MAQYWFSNPRSSDPFDQFRREMDSLLGRFGGATTRRPSAFPAVNLYETVEGYVLTTELPGVRAEDIEVSIEHNRITLRGERKIEHPSEASLHRTERQGGRFRRTLELPSEVDAELVQTLVQEPRDGGGREVERVLGRGCPPGGSHGAEVCALRG